MATQQVTLGYQVQITFKVKVPAKDAKTVDVLISNQDVPWAHLPTAIQMEMILDAFKLCQDANLKPVQGSGRFKIDRIIFDLH